MKIAIHHRPGSYSEQWIIYCKQHNIQYKIVNAYDNDILEQLADCDTFMWHFHHDIYKDHLFAKQLIYVIEKQLGKHTYPDYNTCWHFDDKVGQKYLLEAIHTPFIPTHIFYSRAEAIEWIRHTTFPKVFKLRNGSSSNNVQLVKNAPRAIRITQKAFNRGFNKNNYFRRIADRWAKFRKGKGSLKWVLKGFFTKTYDQDIFHKEEKRYVYFQEFLPDNNYDIRVFVIGDRAVAAKRINRKNDFRASGSHHATFDKNQIDIDYIKVAFEISQKLKMQSVAFDFLKNVDGEIMLSEISYCCGNKDYGQLGGFWTKDLIWHNCSEFNYCDWIIEDLIAQAH